ncbi:acyl transferase [Sphingobacterium sp. lm-10]|uniref:acyl transferase n=1 Tax=Sphingobacterium sp. lm-10 TaxID=2944904 RepID=UPI002020F11B|nr:acyl transferase [Sphingobacterium sp. lm-10]MCL7986792.1 acyl transferase [Sphingobacterium sp. lm-10]
MLLEANAIFTIQDEAAFNALALSIFRFQATHVAVYRKYIAYLGRNVSDVQHYTDIPFLPIEFFKTQNVLVDDQEAILTFQSSGTTGSVTSKHFVTDPSLYEKSYNQAFQMSYGDPSDSAILALLPSYQEREGSSLIYMVNDLISQSNVPESGYFLADHQSLFQTLITLQQKGVKTILFGVTYALLDFIASYPVQFPELIVMETGGMKGRRKEMIRHELHEILKDGFGVPQVHSEYGMTELLSQAYAIQDGIFQTPPWMKVLIRDTNDPLTLLHNRQTGAINVIDLANLYSCAFIATQDLGKLHTDGRFEILGRFDHSDIRGCNLLVQ